MGDFNLDFLKDEFYCEKLKTVITFYGLKQIVTDATRIVQNSQTLIDWALTNYHELHSEVLLSPKISDHSFIKIKILDQNKNVPCKIKVKCFKNYSKAKLSAKLNQMDWMGLENLVFDEKCEFFVTSLDDCVQQLISYKYVDEFSKDNSWFNDNLKQLKLNKEESYLRAVFYNEECYWSEYSAIRNMYVNKLNFEKNNFIKNKLFKCGNNQKLLWKTLKTELIPNKNVKHQVYEYIEFNGVKETNMKEIVNKFNSYFIESIVDINRSIMVVDYDICEPFVRPECNLKFENNCVIKSIGNHFTEH